MAKVQIVQSLSVRDARGSTLLTYMPEDNAVRITNRLFDLESVDDLIEALRAAREILVRAAAQEEGAQRPVVVEPPAAATTPRRPAGPQPGGGGGGGGAAPPPGGAAAPEV